ncbi:MAG: outer membrane protein assembly factor [Bacillota bacterium]
MALRHGKIFSILFLIVVFFVFIGFDTFAAEERIAYVVIEGNQHVATEDVMAQVSRFIRGGEVLSHKNVDLAIQAVMDMGYFSNVIFEYQPSFMGIKAIFRVTEYPLLKEIVFVGLTKITSKDILPYFSIKPGEIINTTTLTLDFIDVIHEKILKKFGVFLLNRNITSVSPEGVITWEMVEAKLLGIKINGLMNTKEEAVRRMLKAKVGEIYDHAVVMDDMQRLLGCKLFEDVSLGSESPDLIQGGITLVYTVKEGKTKQISASIAVDEDKNIVGELGYNDYNLLGTGNRLGLSWMAGDIRDDLSLNLDFPWLNDAGTSLGFTLYDTTLKGLYYEVWDIPPGGTEPVLFHERYDESRRGGMLRISHPLSSRWKTFWELKSEFYEELPRDDFTGEYDRASDYVSHQTNSTSLGLEYNSLMLENSYYIKSGSLYRLETEFAGDTPFGLGLGGDTEYQRYTFESRQFLDLGPDKVLAFRLLGGKIYGDIGEANLFQMGGSETLRGYYPRSFNGDAMALANLEFRHRFNLGDDDEMSYKMYEGVLFYDIGQTWDGTKNTGGAYKYGYGVGFRILIPGIGQLRLDYGWSGENSGLLSFGFNEMF